MFERRSDRDLKQRIMHELKCDSRVSWASINVEVEEQLRAEIESALERRADREAERLRIEVHDGAVNLWGRVHSWQEKRAVIGSIAHATGVTKLKDHLRIEPFLANSESCTHIVKGKDNERRNDERESGRRAKDARDGESVSYDAAVHAGHGTAV